LVVKSVDRRLVTHREPLPVCVYGQLNRGVTELPLNIDRALALLKERQYRFRAQFIDSSFKSTFVFKSPQCCADAAINSRMMT
jgi:hypothetical protein